MAESHDNPRDDSRDHSRDARRDAPIGDLEGQLNALVDGQLSPRESIALVESLVGHPDRERAMAFVRQARTLTERARVALRDDQRGASPALRARIEAMLNAPAPLVEVVEPRPTTTRRPWWRRRAAVALLATAAGVAIGIVGASAWLGGGARVSTIASTTPTLSEAPAEPTRVAVVPARFLVAIGRTHANCSRLGEALHDATFESTDASLAAIVRAGLPEGAMKGDAPDLTAIGFRFVGAGPCSHAGRGVVHLLYRSMDEGSVAALSVFVQADTGGRFERLDAARVYRVTSSPGPFATLAWRAGGATYFLIAEDEPTSLAALQALRPTAPEAIIDAAALALNR